MERRTIQQRIKAVAERFKGCKYLFMNWAQFNVELSEISNDTPSIVYLLPPAGRFRFKNNGMSITDMPETQIAFLIGTEQDFDGEENDELVEKMKRLAEMFIIALNESGDFEMIDGEEITYQVPYDTMDDNLTGVIINLPIVEFPNNMCQMPSEFGFE